MSNRTIELGLHAVPMVARTCYLLPDLRFAVALIIEPSTQGWWTSYQFLRTCMRTEIGGFSICLYLGFDPVDLQFKLYSNNRTKVFRILERSHRRQIPGPRTYQLNEYVCVFFGGSLLYNQVHWWQEQRQVCIPVSSGVLSVQNQSQVISSIYTGPLCWCKALISFELFQGYQNKRKQFSEWYAVYRNKTVFRS